MYTNTRQHERVDWQGTANLCVMVEDERALVVWRYE